MKNFHSHRAVPSAIALPPAEPLNPVREEIKRFLADISQDAERPRTCQACGDELTYVDTVFWLLDEETKWNVRLPICSCSKNAPHTAALPTEKPE